MGGWKWFVSGTMDATLSHDISDAAIESVVAATQLRVTAILARYRKTLPPEEIDDVRSTVVLRIVRRLRGGDDDPIVSFDSFVAAMTFNCVNDVLRQRAPERANLKDRVRLLFARSTRLASWHVCNEVTAGFLEWYGMPPSDIRAGVDAVLSRDDLELAVVALLEANGGPLRLDVIVDAIVAAWGLAEVDSVPLDDLGEEIPSGEDGADAREDLRLLWQEIRELRPNQRQALLLNLRDETSGSAIELFLLLGIATIGEVADALEIAPETLATLSTMLPLDDRTIAEQLGVTRQQVINLRRAARERLARRMGRQARVTAA